ncbi:tetratricopeptide repeat protein 1 (TTC1) [Hirsutella rhossiliensis]|uniref:Tetratricopeptide repeat protein 1 (TTC1) n=1 Tax=Hirsutella rhossiliensis TaxID=111463 RepID=A0A9P8MRG8_9HYPO|nr:tetratricopeptide repeat protein 1 (TTC1) [Hirsutella rhossiliensis]KAH0959935.1 tetratricopeptide repeat protein 1 (TTC1) [Hirsutella rhossiliensis]
MMGALGRESKDAQKESLDAHPEDAADARQEDADEPESLRFSPEEEATLLQESHSIKAEANALFSSHDYHNALSRYDDAVASCPKYLRYERAVLQSNIAATHLKLEQWNEAIKAATDALDGLVELEEPGAAPLSPADKLETSESSQADGRNTSRRQEPPKSDPRAPDTDVEDEIVSEGALKSAPAPPPEPTSQSPAETRKADILRIRTKALLRRARARSEAGGWQNLAGAEEDYRTLAGMPGLGAADLRTVRAQLSALPPRTKAAQDAETAEMWGKLRQLGDGILKPFGLSTQNFQMVQDEKTGGYSVNFSQGGGSSSS